MDVQAGVPCQDKMGGKFVTIIFRNPTTSIDIVEESEIVKYFPMGHKYHMAKGAMIKMCLKM